MLLVPLPLPLPLPLLVIGVHGLLELCGVLSLATTSVEGRLDQFRPVLLGLDTELSRDWLRHLWTLGVELLRIVDSLSQCVTCAGASMANAVILVLGPQSSEDSRLVTTLRRHIGPELGLTVLLRENQIPRKAALLSAGVDLVLSFEESPLLQQAQLMAFSRRAWDARALSISGISIALDGRSRQVCFQECRVPMTDRLFWILELLITHPGDVVSLEKFGAMPAEKSITIQPASIASLVHRLRNILARHAWLRKSHYTVFLEAGIAGRHSKSFRLSRPTQPAFSLLKSDTS